MPSKQGPSHVVVDGSNIATEGRSLPSLQQLQEAVMGFMEEYPGAAVTVVVDATFGHRIDSKERKEYDEAVANNELVAPPAGAVGRGDAFVLGIADKAGATVLSNDSFQEFHGEYAWLFDEGRLIGGKPVPHVGWVWVDRVPVRGPVSRKATRSSKSGSSRSGSSRSGSSRSGSSPSKRASKKAAARTASAAASEPMPVPSAPPPGAAARASEPEPASEPTGERRSAPKGNEPVNDLMPFLDFVEHHPIGTSVNGTVDAYSSHGAYVSIGDSGVRGYVPLRLMADPPPRSAKQVMKIGESVTLVVVSFAASRRSIDCAMPDLAAVALSEASAVDDELEVADDAPPETETPPTTTGAKKAARKKTAAKGSATEKTASRKTAEKKTAAKKTAAKKTTAKKTAAKKTVAKKTAGKKTAAKKTAGKKTAAKKTAAKKTAAKKTAAKKTGAKKTAAKKTAAKKTASRRGTSGSASSEES